MKRKGLIDVDDQAPSRTSAVNDPEGRPARLTYPEALRHLESLGNEMKTARLGLGRIQRLLAALGNPHLAYRVVHVAGTNGKGSTCAMIEAGLRAAGIRTGLFTSPHLIEPTERIQTLGMPVSRDEFAQALQRVMEAARTLPADDQPTFFETLTAMGFWLFREKRVETAVVEVGLGGRLDATNTVEPALTVITPVDLDHQAYLGTTIEAIAAEKAGIIKAKVPLVMARQHDEAEAVIRQAARRAGAQIIRSADFPIRDVEIDARGSRFAAGHFASITCSLAGEHQMENALVAALALEELGVSYEGVAEVQWPARLEHISPNPDVILDGAHNPAGARALRRYLERFYGERRRWIVFGAMRDKAVEEMGGILFPLAHELIFTAPANSRAYTPEELVSRAGRGRAVSNIQAALALLRDEVSPDDVVVITGSLFLAGEARAASYNKNSWPFSGAWS